MVKYTGFTGHMIIQEIKGQKWQMIKYTGQTGNTGHVGGLNEKLQICIIIRLKAGS